LKEVPLNGVRKLDLANDGSFYFGDTLFFKENSVLRATRGRSDILASADYLDIYSEFVFSRAERSLFSNIFMWDVKCEGMDQTDIDKFAKDHPPPKPGAGRFHNEKVTWTAVAPDLKAHDASYDARLLKGFNLGAVGYPEHFFGEAGDVNRATATEMNEPVMKMLTSRQRTVKGMLTKLCDFALDKGRASQIIRPAVPSPKDYQLYFPELSSKDMQKSGLTMQYLAQSLSIAEQAGWVTKEGASRLYAQVASTFGPDINPAFEEDPTWFDAKKKQEAKANLKKAQAPPVVPPGVNPASGTQIPAKTGGKNAK
jgi:DNA-binding HxlR family transcriptional regulator